jgi:hypothetical protein
VTSVSDQDAVARVRAAVGASESVEGRAWRVRRLDRPGESYYLVVLGAEDASVAVGTVDATTGEVGSWARLEGCGTHLTVDGARARALAGADERADAELVWRPSPVTKSPLYPVWEVVLPSRLAYVDQAGTVRPDPP